MANTFAPNGFNVCGSIDGVTPNGAERAYQIQQSNTAAIFHGDIVALSGGYLVQAVATSVPIGVFVGCEFQMSALNNQSRWSPWWPGSGATSGTTPTGYVVDDPSSLMLVQSGTLGQTAVAQSQVGAKFNLGNASNGNTVTGISQMYLDVSGAGTQFIVAGLTGNDMANGGDNTTAYNNVYVTFATQVYQA